MNEAAELNDWFDRRHVVLEQGDARQLPLADASVDFAAQNCLFNIFERADLDCALHEMHRVLRAGRRLSLSDPVSTQPIPAHLAGDARLRAMCLSGAVTIETYLGAIVEAGFGSVEVRARRPYRVLDSRRYGTDHDILLESLEVVAIKQPVPADGPCIFTGRSAIFRGDGEYFDDGRGHVLLRDVPAGVCDKTAAALARLGRDDIVVTPSTWHYCGDGCC